MTIELPVEIVRRAADALYLMGRHFPDCRELHDEIITSINNQKVKFAPETIYEVNIRKN